MILARAAYFVEIRYALSRWAGKPARWGRDDCALALADIDVAVQGIDPAAEYRGRYDTEEGARALLGRGRLAGGWAKAARRLGWRRLAKAEIPAAGDGDRAVVEGPAGLSSAIRFGRFWVGRLDCGHFLVTDAQVKRAWSVL